MRLKSTPEVVDQMEAMYKRGYSCRKIALHFDLHQTNVSRALNKRGVVIARGKAREITPEILEQVRTLRANGTVWWRVEEIMGFNFNHLRVRLKEESTNVE